MNVYQDVEQAVLSVLAAQYSRTIYELWFKDLKLVSLTESQAVFSVNSHFKKNIIQTKHAGALQAALTEVIGFEVDIVIVSSEEEDGFRLPSFTEPQPPEPAEEEQRLDTGKAIESRSIVEEYTFENFIVGDSNKFAHAACVAVANEPTTYNPLFIHGPSGLGKTHLLYAVTNEIKRHNPDVKLIYKKGEEFTNELIESIQRGTTATFREKYRRADVLLIDDIQFIAGKESTQEEFFHTFNALYESEKQIILTSDRPPRDIKTLEERLSSRFEWGLIADIQPPSFELRIAIINKKAEERGISLSPEIVTYLAENLQANIRQIEGSIKKIAAISMLTGTPVSLDMSKRAIADILAGSVPVSVTVDKILHAVSRKYGVSVEDIKGKKRHENIVSARHLCVYLVRKQTSLPLTAIGEIFERDHSTILSSIKNVEEQLKQTKHMEGELEELLTEIKK
ncbi:MAG: chromosomal replication initiator protein DnaA [Eubacteriales bacterium]